ncbi:MAG TPA: hypothetical protein VGW12_10080 [Pyrinomonadaceae bacterium]|nr:hypothetical protein [Pyrinomonadaceae bacterium]
MKFDLSDILTLIYLLLAGGAMFLIVAFPPPDDMAYLSILGLGAIGILTLPWSSVLVLFAWALFHDTQNPIFLLFFAGCTVLNVYLFRKLVSASNRASGSK